MAKRILFDCERMKYPYTGLYSFCKELGTAIIRNGANQHELNTIFYVPNKEKGVFGKNEKYLIQKSRHKIFSPEVSKCNIWHCTYQGSNYLPSAKSNLKIVSTIHDLNFLHQGKPVARQKKYLQKVQRLLDRSDRIVTISNYVKNQVLEHLNTGGKNIEVIYNGTNMPHSEFLQNPQHIEAKPFFFSIGTITEKKNFHILPALLTGNDYNLIIAGVTRSSDYHKKIMTEARKFGVANRVKLIGPVSDEEKFWLYKNCAALCFPSIAEGFGLPIVEAMQFGTPVILSKETSLPEIGGPYAIYFERLNPESVKAAADDFLNKEISEQTRRELKQWAARFDWNIAAQRYLNIYSLL